jgi:membrane fusion protein, multidrug efflux system
MTRAPVKLYAKHDLELECFLLFLATEIDRMDVLSISTCVGIYPKRTQMKTVKFMTLVAVIFFAAISPALAQKRDGGTAPAPNVVVSAAKIEPFSDHVEALGTLRANETVTLTATVTQTVTAINFTDGQRVEKGHVLIEMTSGEEKAQLEQARAVAAEAKQQLERVRELAKKGASSQSLLDERQRDYNSAAARLRETESRLQNFLITAPFSGVVGLRNISVGALLQPGTKITTLDDDNVMKLDFAVPSVYLSELKIGAPVVAIAREYPDRKFTGTVASIDSQIDPVTRSIVVRAMLPNEEKLLRPGLLISVDLISNQRNAIVIPEESLIPEGKNNYVYIIDPSQTPPVAHKREVVIGTRKPGKV